MTRAKTGIDIHVDHVVKSMHFMQKLVIEKKHHVGLERDRQIQVAVAARCQYASLRTMSSQIR